MSTHLYTYLLLTLFAYKVTNGVYPKPMVFGKIYEGPKRRPPEGVNGSLKSYSKNRREKVPIASNTLQIVSIITA